MKRDPYCQHFPFPIFGEAKRDQQLLETSAFYISYTRNMNILLHFMPILYITYVWYVTMFNFIFNDRPLCSYTPLKIQRQEVIGLHTFRCCRQPCRALARILSPGYPRYIPSKKNKNAWKSDAWKTPFLLGYRHLFQEFQAVSHFK